MLGFDVKFVSPEDLAWGNDIGNNSYNGMVGMVQRYLNKEGNTNSIKCLMWQFHFHREEADICTSGLTASYERRQAVAFTTTLLFFEMGVTIPKANAGMLRKTYHLSEED